MSDSNKDITLWNQLKAGDQDALGKIYHEEIQFLIGYGRKFTSDINLIEDAIHDTFVYIWNKRTSLSPTDSIRRYLMVAVRNKILKLIKQSGLTVVKEEIIPGDNQSSIEQELIIEESRLESIRLIDDAMQVLSKRQREAIYLRYNGEMSYEDICEIMNINYQSVRNLISTGIKKIQSTIKK